MTTAPVPRAAGWRGLLRGNILWLSVASFLNDASSEMIFPLLPLFLVGTLGAGPAFLGLVEGVAETTASFIKLGGGWLSDRIHRRRGLVAGGYALAAIARPFLAAAAAPWHVLAVRFTDRAGKGVRTAPRDALLAESVDAPARGRAFGFHRAADHAGAVLGPLLASGILLLAPGRLRLVFLLAVIPAVLSVVAVLAGVREARRGKPASPPEPEDRLRVTARPDPRPARDRRYFGFLVVVVVFTLGNASDAFLLLRAADLGVPAAAIPLLWVALHVSKVFWNVAGGAVVDRAGARPALVTGWLVNGVVYAGFALATEPWQAWALFLGYGLYFGLAEPAERVMVAALAGDAARGRAFGGFHFAIGMAALPASVIFGVLWETTGPGSAFLLGGALSVLAAALLPGSTPPSAAARSSDGSGPRSPGSAPPPARPPSPA